LFIRRILLGTPPCEAAPDGTNGNGSEGSNLGPSNPVLINAVKAYTNYLHSLGVARNSDGTNAAMPVDMVTGDFTGFDLALNQDVINGAAG
jgi:K+-transporting ATPase c subunit